MKALYAIEWFLLRVFGQVCWLVSKSNLLWRAPCGSRLGKVHWWLLGMALAGDEPSVRAFVRRKLDGAA
ncbi:MAG: hypothetical protein D6775_16165 [Caldilineae bacterium]|nr:MAG: hypothetical protein D6775_16165 [Caldilineae bacterium]